VKEDRHQDANQSRRKALKMMAYIPPAVFTLSAMPFAASYGSGGCSGSQDGNNDCQGNEEVR
jgi:hypothetical protein